MEDGSDGIDDVMADGLTDENWEDIPEGTLEGSVLVIEVDFEGVVDRKNEGTTVGLSDCCNVRGDVSLLDG